MQVLFYLTVLISSNKVELKEGEYHNQEIFSEFLSFMTENPWEGQLNN